MNFLTETIATAAPTEATIAATEAATEAMNLQFEPMEFVENLKHMGVGMLVIFVLIGVIILATKLVGLIKSK